MANEEKTTEELEKQRQQQVQMQAEWQKQMKLQQMQQIIMSTDPSTVLKTMSNYQGISLFCNNPWISMQLLNTIYTDLLSGSIDDDTLKTIADSLNRAIQYTNQRRMNFGMGMNMNPMMGMGMGMMPNMNMMGMQQPMMGMGMNPMMMGGFGMMNPMMMGGMNMMGMQQQTQQKDGSDNIAVIKQFIETNLKPTNMNYAVDPLIFLQILISTGIDVDFSEDKNFSQLCSNAIICAIYSMDNWSFNSAYCVILSIYQSNYQQQCAEAMKKNGGNNSQNNMMGMMNPMMMGMGMNPMMMGGMGMMNPMMGMQMPGNFAMGLNNDAQNNMMGFGMNMGCGMPMGMMNPMMGMGMGMMPGMNNFGVQGNTGAIW